MHGNRYGPIACVRYDDTESEIERGMERARERERERAAKPKELAGSIYRQPSTVSRQPSTVNRQPPAVKPSSATSSLRSTSASQLLFRDATSHISKPSSASAPANHSPSTFSQRCIPQNCSGAKTTAKIVNETQNLSCKIFTILKLQQFNRNVAHVSAIKAKPKRKNVKTKNKTDTTKIQQEKIVTTICDMQKLIITRGS